MNKKLKKLRPRKALLCALTITTLFIFGITAAAGRVSGAENEVNWYPEELKYTIEMQAAYNEEEIFFRFRYQSENASWYHDYIVYEGGEWNRYGSPPVGPDPHGLYEDRLSLLIDDGSVKGFDNFGGWLTIHEGMRSLDSEVDSEEVEAHGLLGVELGRTDIRKYIPQTREGEWWEGRWDETLSQEETDQLFEQGVFIDLWQWRAHRSNPVGYVDDGYVLEYRHGDDGRGMFTNNPWDEETGPEYMFDKEEVGFSALEFDKLLEGEYGQDDIYYLHEDFMVPLDENEMFEGAAIPRRPLREPEGSRAAVKGEGIWEDGYWTVEMRRDLDTGHPDDKAFYEGESYHFALAAHIGATGSRWHYVSYPYELKLGEDADVEAAYFEGDYPVWEDVPTNEIPVIYPGQVTWSWLVSESHPGYQEVRDNKMSIWDIHSDPFDMAHASAMLDFPFRTLSWEVIFVGLITFAGSVFFAVKAFLKIRRSL